MLDNSFITLPNPKGLNNNFTIAGLEFNSPTVLDLQAGTDQYSTVARTLELVGVSSSTPLMSVGTQDSGDDVYLGGQVSGHGQITLDLATASGDSDVFDVYEASGDRTRLYIIAPIVGTGGIKKTDTGHLDLGCPFSGISTALNTFSGGVELAGGTLGLGQSSSGSPGSITNSPLGTGTLTIDSGTYLENDYSGSITIANAMSITGGFTVEGSSGGSSVTWNGPVSLGSSTSTVTFNTNMTVNGAISGSGSAGFTKAGSSALMLGGANSIPGTTTVSAGNVTVAANTGSGIQARTLAALTISSGASFALAGTAANQANRTVQILNSLSLSGSSGAWTSKVDVAENDMIIHNANAGTQTTNLATLTNQLKSGYNGGTWNAPSGITSSVATSSSYTSIGITSNLTPSGTPLYTTFDGQPVSGTDILTKYTYGGDATLAGTVTSLDYLITDNGEALKLTGWQNGDFNYDGVINSEDYAILDASYDYLNPSDGLEEIEAMPHWQIPGYAAYFLPIYEADFGELTPAAYDAALTAGTPAGEPMPQSAVDEFNAEVAEVAAENGNSVSNAVVASVPEPATCLLAIGVLGVGTSRLRRRHG